MTAQGTSGVPRLTLAGDVPGATRLEAARWAVGETAETGRSPLPDPREDQPWLMLRSGALLTDSHLDVQPYGFRLLSGSTRVSAAAAEQLDAEAEAFVLAARLESGTGSPPAVTVTLWGPVTLAARLSSPLGERLVADPGAVRHLGEALADGVRSWRERMRQAHGLEIEPVLREDSLDDALDGRLPTASGFRRHRPLGEDVLRSVFAPWKAAGLGGVLTGVRRPSRAAAAGTAAGASAAELVRAGDRWAPSDVERTEALAEAGLGALLAVDPGRPADGRELAQAVETAGASEEDRARLGLWCPPGLRRLGAAQGAAAAAENVAMLRSLGESFPGSARERTPRMDSISSTER
ncbi:hypothetical protein [Arthrobacter sp. UM1]|uniref:hypothetical protein n=1 Tax=Arthrobacter sp. UM1 TaxID=2766776 RepID=UPI001CF69B9C|nr:hypothetical protein [Arthrobacter sp. UM1]MCB4207782.1 hypothetical protein [Arthrobacter sp. UM1]